MLARREQGTPQRRRHHEHPCDRWSARSSASSPGHATLPTPPLGIRSIPGSRVFRGCVTFPCCARVAGAATSEVDRLSSTHERRSFAPPPAPALDDRPRAVLSRHRSVPDRARSVHRRHARRRGLVRLRASRPSRSAHGSDSLGDLRSSAPTASGSSDRGSSAPLQPTCSTSRSLTWCGAKSVRTEADGSRVWRWRSCSRSPGSCSCAQRARTAHGGASG